MGNNRYFHKKKPQRDDKYQPPFPAEVLEEPVTVLSFKNENTYSLLDGAGVKTLGDVLKREEKDFYRILTFNKKNLMDVINSLKPRGLFLKPAPVKEEKPEGSEPQQEKNEEPVQRDKRPEKRDMRNPAVKPDGKNNQERRTEKPANAEKKPYQGERREDRPQRDGQRQTNQGNRNTEQHKRSNQQKSLGKNVASSEFQKEQGAKAAKVPSDIYVKVNKNDKWGFSDRNGNIVVQPEYDEVYSYKDDLCCVEKDEHFGFINRQGEEIIPVSYELAFSFSEGYACVYRGGKCGYINAANEVIVDFKFDAGTAVTDGSCRIKKDGKWGELRMDDITNIRWIL